MSHQYDGAEGMIVEKKRIFPEIELIVFLKHFPNFTATFGSAKFSKDYCFVWDYGTLTKIKLPLSAHVQK
jgi:hypothetical protein